jgi:hypothetical protein
MQTLTREEMLEIEGGDWTDVAWGSLWGAAIALAILILWQLRQFCQMVLSNWRRWWTKGPGV